MDASVSSPPSRPAAQRAEKSCSQCRARKIKCDMQFPRCGGCAIRGLACEFTPRRKPGPSKGVVWKRRQHHQHHIINSNNCNNAAGFINDQAVGQRSSGHTPGARPTSSDGKQHSASLSTADTAVASPSKGDSPLFSPMESGTPQAATELENCCIDAYKSIQRFPYLPPLEREQIFAPSVGDSVRSALIHAVCAVSITSARNIGGMSATSCREAASRYHKRAKSALLRHVLEQDHLVTLSMVKIAVILAVYELTCSPGGKGWYMVGEAVRLAYDMGLDQVDGAQHGANTLLSPQEAEEQRSVWWCVYALDTYASSTLMRPFAISNTVVKTALVGVVPPDNPHELTETVFLPSDPIGLQIAMQSLHRSHLQSPEMLHLLLLSMVRQISTLRRRQLEGDDVAQSLELIQNLLASWWFSLPDDFLENGPAAGGHPRARMLCIETAILAHLASLSVDSFSLMGLQRNGYPGTIAQHLNIQGQWGSDRQTPSLSSWNKCISSAMGILSIVRSLSAQELYEISPFSVVILWLPAVALVLQMRSSSNTENRDNAESALQVLKAALKKLASCWVIAQSIEEAVTLLCVNQTSTTSIQDACHTLYMYGSAMVSVSSSRVIVRIPPMATARTVAPGGGLSDWTYCGNLEPNMMDHLESWSEIANEVDEEAALEGNLGWLSNVH